MPSPSSILYPPDLPRPLADGAGLTTEDNQFEFQPCVGVPRRRNRMRSTPTLFNVQFLYTVKEYEAFDDWWHSTLQGGAREFDALIQTLPSIMEPVWYTFEWLGEYTAEYVDGGYWRVNGRWRTKYDAFYYRSPGTDDLHGTTVVGVVPIAKGKLLVGKSLHASATEYVGVVPEATGRLEIAPLRGTTLVGVGTAKGRLRWVDLRGRSVVEVTPVGELQVGP